MSHRSSKPQERPEPTTRDLILASVCRESFFEFMLAFWEEVPGAGRLVMNWHMKFLCDELQVIAERVFLGLPSEYDLLANVSPGTSKSTIFSILFHPWTWTRMPEARHIVTSHTDTLVLDLATKARTVIVSEKYQRLFPEIELKKDQDMKGLYANTRGGSRFSCTVGGKTPTGFHAQFRSMDDPLDPQRALSAAELLKAGEYKTTVLDSRTTDASVSAFFCVMQRVHSTDPSGVMIEKAKLEGSKPLRHICLPARIEGDKDNVNPPELKAFYVDGLMDPTRLNNDILSRKLVTMGQYAFSGQYMQSPVPLSGGMFKETYFLKRVKAAPYDCVRIRYVDRASTQDGGCYSAGVLIGKDKDGNYYIEHAYHGQWEPTERNRMMRANALRDRNKYGQFQPTIVVEAEGGSSGRDAWMGVVKALDGFYVVEDKVTGNKVTRAEPWSAQLAAGNVFLVENGTWDINGYVNEHCLFPLGKYKDLVDACLVGGTMVMTDQGEKVIEGVLEGDRVLTRKGFKKVLWSGRSGYVDELVSVLFSNGSVVTGTPDHKIWTQQRGWITLDACAGDDYNIVIAPTGESEWKTGESERRKSGSIRRRSGSMDSRTIGAPASGTIGGQVGIPSTEPFGNTTTGASPIAAIYITGTPTGTTTTCRILNVSLEKNMRGSIERIGARRSISAISRKFAPSLNNGTERKRARSFIARLVRSLGRGGSPESTPVSSAKRGSCPEELSSCTVPPSATTVLATPLVSTSGTPRLVLRAKKSSWGPRKSRRVPESAGLSFDGNGRVVVYDLTVEDEPEFFANGVLVHNSTGAYNRLVNRRHAGTLRIVGLNRRKKGQLMVVACSREELPSVPVENKPYCLISVSDPVRATSLGEVIESLREIVSDKELIESAPDRMECHFADLEPENFQDRWDEPVEEYGRKVEELVMTREIGKSIWKFLTKPRDRPPEILIIVDDGDGRALSLASAIVDTLRLPRSTIYQSADPDSKSEGPPPNRFVYELTKHSRGLVCT